MNTKARLKGPEKGEINDSIPPLFGMTPKFKTNHVFPKNKYKPLVKALISKKKKGESVMHHDTYKVIKNSHYGIEGGWDVDVLWVYNENVKTWKKNCRLV